MSRKRKVITSYSEPATVDRIGECPDSLLVHILSLLPIEDAVRTQVLSKRWQLLWTFLPSLLFRSPLRYPVFNDDDSDDEDFRVASSDEFTAFVDKTLMFSNSKVEKFEVGFEYEPRFASSVDSWTWFAAGKGVEELHLQLWPDVFDLHEDERYELPQILYGNSKFRELLFSCCRVIPKGNVAWYSLKKLSIGYVNLSSDVIEKILAGSPVLEMLELHHCEGFRRLSVTNSCVKKLILRDFLCNGDEFGSGLEISAPYLLSLEMSGGLGRSCRFMNVSSLVDAVFNCQFVCAEQDRANDTERIQDMVRGLLASLVHVKNLMLGAWAIEVLSIMEAKGLSCPLLECECLTVHTQINKHVLLGIASILKSTPNLERLAMTLSLFLLEYNRLVTA
ncbi:putative F-box protein At1g49610 isoform X2 [Rhododendron vialii]|uniref:putative F-box protein At1g49610 isoform X2 n=1 Tax=Rhododendron vialii TaxID=182163 RepID=UPI00265F63CD|nr:putative F-box protein At1g49610 isoform X2 [Rhododendron vialii]